MPSAAASASARRPPAAGAGRSRSSGEYRRRCGQARCRSQYPGWRKYAPARRRSSGSCRSARGNQSWWILLLYGKCPKSALPGSPPRGELARRMDFAAADEFPFGACKNVLPVASVAEFVSTVFSFQDKVTGIQHAGAFDTSCRRTTFNKKPPDVFDLAFHSVVTLRFLLPLFGQRDAAFAKLTDDRICHADTPFMPPTKPAAGD